MVDSRALAENLQDELDHLLVPESKKVQLTVEQHDLCGSTCM